MVKLLDRVKMTVTGTPGTGNITLNAAEAGFQTFAQAGAVDTNVVRYAVTDGTGFEIGTAVLSSSATVMARTVEQSSNSNNALNLTSSAVVFATLSAADLSGNAAPIWTTTPPSSLDLYTDGSTAVTLAGVAIDDFPVSYSWDGHSGTTLYNDSNLPPQLASAPTFSGGTASLIGSSTLSNEGTFNFRMKASDGVKTATAITAVSLNFAPDMANAVYDNVSFSVASQDGSMEAIAFSASGHKMYVVGQTSDTIYEYGLASNFDLSTASYSNVSFSVASKDNYPYGLAFSASGDKMYIVGAASEDVFEYNLSTNWLISSAVYSTSFDTTSQDGTPQDLQFSASGDKMYIVGSQNDTVYEYNLSTNWLVSSASYNNVSLSVTSQEATPSALNFSSSGKKMYILGYTSDAVYQYSLSTAFDLSTATYDNVSFSVSAQDGSSRGIAFSANNSKMYMVGHEYDAVFQYSC